MAPHFPSRCKPAHYVAPQSFETQPCCKCAARWHHNRCNPHPSANLQLGGTKSLQCPSRCKPATRWCLNHSNPIPTANLPLDGTPNTDCGPIFTFQERPLVANMGTTWWQGSYDPFPPPTKISDFSPIGQQAAEKSTFYPPGAPPGGRYWHQLVA